MAEPKGHRRTDSWGVFIGLQVRPSLDVSRHASDSASARAEPGHTPALAV